MDMQNDLAALVSKYGTGINLAKELKKLYGGDTTKRAKLEAALDRVISDYGTITLTRFKKEAAKAWHRAFPDGVEKRELKGYQLFVKENMPRVKEENPGKTHMERMVIIGKMWQDSKGTAPEPEPEPTPEEDETPNDEPSTEDTQVEDKPAPRNKRGKRASSPIVEVEGMRRRPRRG